MSGDNQTSAALPACPFCGVGRLEPCAKDRIAHYSEGCPLNGQAFTPEAWGRRASRQQGEAVAWDATVFKGADGLKKLADSQEFW